MKSKSEAAPQITVTSTSCKNCCFATYDGDTQIGCGAERLEKFRNNGIDVLDVYDDDKEFFLVKDKICVYYRSPEMFQEQPEDLLEVVKQQLLIPYHMILFLRDKDSLEDLNQRICEINKQKMIPKILTVMDLSFEKAGVRGADIADMLKQESFGVWRVQQPLEIPDPKNDPQHNTVIEADTLDLCYDSTKKQKFLFYITFEVSQPIPETFSAELQSAIHDDMERFVILLPNKHNCGKAVLKTAHEKYAGGSFGISIEQKIKHYEDSVHLIRKVSDLCPSLKT